MVGVGMRSAAGRHRYERRIGDRTHARYTTAARLKPERSFSLVATRGIVKDLFTPRPAIYWADFLTSILAGHACYSLTRNLPAIVAHYDPEFPAWATWGVRGVFFVLACLLYFRAVSFIHELAHLPERKFRTFRIAWNLLCGLPFLAPSSMYYPHLDHHRRKVFGTSHDGEYLPLATGSPWGIIAFLSQCLWVGPLVVPRYFSCSRRYPGLCRRCGDCSTSGPRRWSSIRNTFALIRPPPRCESSACKSFSAA